MPMAHRVLALATFLVLGGCDDTVPTKPGTIVLDAAANDELSVKDWSLGAEEGPITRVEHTYLWKPGKLGDDVRFRLAFGHGPVELVDPSPLPDKPDAVLVPRAIAIDIVDNDQWAITGHCRDDLSVPLAVRDDGTSAYPSIVWASCDLVMKRKNGDITLRAIFEIYGDGKVEATALGSDQALVMES